MRSGSSLAGAVWGALLLVSVAHAAVNPKAGALIKEGDRLYKENKYREAAEALKKAWELEPSPVLLYNIARAYDQAGELKLALDYYRQFVGSEGGDPALAKKANLAMDRLRTLVAKDEAGKQLQDAEKKRLEEEARAAIEKAAAETDKARIQKEAFEAKEQAALEAAQKKSSSRLVAAIVVGSVGVAALGGGITFGLLARSSQQDFKAAATVADKRRFESDTRTRALIADLGFGTALAAAVATVILWPKGSPTPEKAVEVTFAPIPGGGVAGLQGRF